jgi:hypothetical protein
VTLSAVYAKLNGIEGDVSAAFVRHTAARLGSVVEGLVANCPPAARLSCQDH